MNNFLIVTNMLMTLVNTPTYEYNVSSQNYELINEHTINPLSSSNYDHSESINELELSNTLEEMYPGYEFYVYETNTTRSVTNAIPISVYSENFPDTDINNALIESGVKSSYGGCGPLAMIGILDYFSRYLGYEEIMKDPTSSSDRIKLATEVLTNVKTYEVSDNGVKQTLCLPWDYEKGFNTLMNQYNLENILSCSYIWKLTSGDKEKYWNVVTENIDNGLPITLMTGILSGEGDFAKHCSNIFGYEIWYGYNKETDTKIEKKLIKAKLNLFESYIPFYCDADILNDGMIALATYNINYNESYTMVASDFKEEFVNINGGGQYFYDNKEAYVTLSSGRMIKTNRLRCSYIENKYLVLSPKREGAGISYLDIELPHNLSKLSFDASLWSDLEYHEGEYFYIEIFKDDNWIYHGSLDVDEFITLKDHRLNYQFIFPKQTNRFRFYVKHNNPIGNRNKGRVVLDNIKLEYNLTN